MQSEKNYRFSKSPAVVVGACAHGLALLRALSVRDIPLLALDTDASLPGASTALASFERIADINGPALLDALLELRDRIDCPGQPVLFLTNDWMVASIGADVARLAGRFHLSWAHCAGRLVPLLDKAALAPWTGRQGLRYPPSLMVGSDLDIRRAVEEIGFPCIVKPSRPLGGFKTYLPQTADDLRRWIALHRSDLPFVVQKFIPGDDRQIYFSALYLDRGKVLTRYDGHKLRSYPLGHTTIAESRRDDEIHRHALKFFEGGELSGPVSLEVKRGPDGTLWVIEPTVGRTDFWIGLCTANGVNLPLVEYCHQVGIAPPAAAQTDEAVWFNEERDPLGRAWLALQPGLWLNGRGSVYLYFHRGDPRPAVKAVLKAATRAQHRMSRWLHRRWGRRTTASGGRPALRSVAGDAKSRIAARPGPGRTNQ